MVFKISVTRLEVKDCISHRSPINLLVLKISRQACFLSFIYCGRPARKELRHGAIMSAPALFLPEETVIASRRRSNLLHGGRLPRFARRNSFLGGVLCRSSVLCCRNLPYLPGYGIASSQKPLLAMTVDTIQFLENFEYLLRSTPQ